MQLDPKIWGPQYWFVLHTIALNYPLNPNSTVKKKYYDFIQNLPLFIPISEMGNNFSKTLDEFPVTPYLDSRESFIKWMYFIHNKINISLSLPEKTLDESLKNYYELYKPKEIIIKEDLAQRKKYLFSFLIIGLIGFSFYLYKK